MDVKELDKWYLTKEYDPQAKELNKILKLGNLNNKDILIIGTYGVMAISFKLLPYTKSITAIHNNKQIINYCKKKGKSIRFIAGDIIKLNFRDKKFDTIISLWGGLHYLKNKTVFIKNLKRILKDEGILLIEEADETSEYVKILNIISPNKELEIEHNRMKLKCAIAKDFKIKETKLKTYYYFKNSKQFKEYFKKELIFDNKQKFTPEIENKLSRYLSKKKSLKIEEKSVFFMCKKLNLKIDNF